MTVSEMNRTIISEQHFEVIYQIMMQENDMKNADKILELYDKYVKEQFNICFAGHFSAGKSSIINSLLEKDVLPKSPIPTSANIVKITSGDGSVRVFFKDEDPVQYNEPYDMDIIKEYCVNRDTIKQIEISTKEQILPEKCALLDTPGIDAANDADRLMTESAIHLVDVLFYVMDYNHVQSEVNLYFLRKMKSLGIPIYIIINQVDKHNEEELAFIDYDIKVKQTFDQWDIQPNHIYYSSVTKNDVAFNELNQLKTNLFTMMRHAKGVDNQILKALTTIVEDHKRFVEEKYTTESGDNIDMTYDEFDLEKITILKKRLEKIEIQKQRIAKDFSDEIQLTLKNAYLMPANLRDLAAEFLVSRQKDFKIGFFQAQKKTTEEQERRLTSFYDALINTIESTIQWKLREKTISLIQEYKLTDETLLKEIQKLKVIFHKDDLFTFMKQGATINGNYILNYTNDLSSAIKNKFRTEANHLWGVIEKTATKKWQNEKEELELELKPFRQEEKRIDEQKKANNMVRQKQQFISDQLENPTMEIRSKEALSSAMKYKNKIEVKETPKIIKDIQPERAINIQKVNSPERNRDVTSIISSIDHVVDEVMNVDGFHSIINDLQDKKDRLMNRELTIALFGTFSAGKSSFSNALFGDKVLPVSPNPTTAVISRISPVTNQYSHGTVFIAFKTEEEIIQDLTVMTKHLEKDANTLVEWMNWIKKHHIHQNDALSKSYQSYMEAIIAGYDQQKDALGKTIEISLEQFPFFVTDETIACFIKHVDLFYDCALTRRGITLVDTPGADSVNARHTNVAFDYIKEADAIIYVTYYNHAITSGDRDFLMQLGRVKEAFEMDKMFFIVNASDLAENKTDLQIVVQYVQDQLLQFGIRNPKIYPVSSKRSLEDKLNQINLNDEMKEFEEEFYHFIEKDLIALTVESALWDMNRAKKTLEQFISSLKLNETEREKKINKLKEQKETCIEMIINADTNVFSERLINRIERQLHFVLDRFYIRFHDMFTEYFNPSTINASGKKAVIQLEKNRNQFIDYAGYELLQEVRAVSLRIESYIKELMKDADELIQRDIMDVNESFNFSSLGEVQLDTPYFDQAFESLDVHMFDKALKVFKNMKSFFEQNERENMKNLFYEFLQSPAKEYLDMTEKIMGKSYKDQWYILLQDRKEKVCNEITLIVENYINMLTKSINIEELQGKYDKVTETTKKIS